MGVTGLWTVVQPCARPIKLETLNKKRLAVDASIWIYQFLKAVRDKEGNALRNSHVVGFFRRICKLLFVGIKPVFVFDGGAPILKRQTVTGRKARREGRREDAVRTAGKLLAVQMQRRAEEDDQRRRDDNQRSIREDNEEEEVPENPVYVDELQMTAQERQQNRTFRKKDAYHLPNLDVDLTDMGAPNDPRIMSHEELEDYARQFHTGEDVNVYDFSKIDFESPFFQTLPASDRYNILNAARLRSRLRMGYSKEQLDTMFPNRMDFSRFQIERVKERNELTQRLMNLNGMNGEDAMFDKNSGGRVAGEKGKEYVLVKNDGVEGGWALGVVSNKHEGERNRPIDVEKISRNVEVLDEEDEEWEDDGFEDVPIEGLNRLPKHLAKARTDREDMPFDSEEMAKQRRALYEARMESAGRQTKATEAVIATEEDPDSLFIGQTNDDLHEDEEDANALFEDVPIPGEDEDDDLQKAIAMSLMNETEEEEAELPTFSASAKSGPRVDQPLDFNARNAKAGRQFAHLANARAFNVAPKPLPEDSDEDDFNLNSALEESRQTKRKPFSGPRVHGFKRPDVMSVAKEASGTSSIKMAEVGPQPTQQPQFDGPLPFESLSLGISVLGKKKKKPVSEQPAGGFEQDEDKEVSAEPLPPWFSGDIRNEVAKQKAIEERQFEEKKRPRIVNATFDPPILRRDETGKIIDLDAVSNNGNEPIAVDSSEDEDDDQEILEVREIVSGRLPVDQSNIATDEQENSADVPHMEDVADLVQAAPPTTRIPNNAPSIDNIAEAKADLISAVEDEADLTAQNDISSVEEGTGELENIEKRNQARSESIEHSPSSHMAEDAEHVNTRQDDSMPDLQASLHEDNATASANSDIVEQGDVVVPRLFKEESHGRLQLDDLAVEENEEDFSDPEDADLMRQLAVEAEEHARFARSLNQKSHLENAEDYERELRQLRSQQKKDRRDADEVTHIMITECQQLLRLFGLPYVTAPMEAEAQCAELVTLGLVDGIVTDDSDIFLFGGTRVYKNMFNQAKFVECYLTSDLEKEYSLTREKLIQFAHLLGSDYTEGLPSVGPVTALEILSDFDTLEDFSEWWSAVQMAQKPSDEDKANPFRRKFRKNASKLFLPTTFPDKRVDHAYLHPEVDKDPQPFQWGVPDLNALRSFLMATIGWSQERTDEVLVPVIRDMNKRESEGTQANITHFFGGSVGVGANPNQNSGSDGSFAPRKKGEGKSKRMETALGRLRDKGQDRSHEERSTDLESSNASTIQDGSLTAKQPVTPRRARTKKRSAPQNEDLSQKGSPLQQQQESVAQDMDSSDHDEDDTEYGVSSSNSKRNRAKRSRRA